MMNSFMKAYGEDYKSICLLKITHCGRDLAPVVQKLYNAFHWMYLCPVDNAIGFPYRGSQWG